MAARPPPESPRTTKRSRTTASPLCPNDVVSSSIYDTPCDDEPSEPGETPDRIRRTLVAAATSRLQNFISMSGTESSLGGELIGLPPTTPIHRSPTRRSSRARRSVELPESTCYENLCAILNLDTIDVNLLSVFVNWRELCRKYGVESNITRSVGQFRTAIMTLHSDLMGGIITYDSTTILDAFDYLCDKYPHKTAAHLLMGSKFSAMLTPDEQTMLQRFMTQ